MNRIGPEMVDVAFGMEAQRLPADYEWPLYREVVRVAPWIARIARAGIHPVRAVSGGDGTLLVARRAKLVVRMPRDRMCAASALEGAVLHVGEVTVKLGEGVFRRLEPSATLYSPRVVTGDDDESAFSEHLARELEELGVARPFICGRRATVRLEEGPAAAFGVAVHGLGEAASILLQDAGLGRGRAIGCGMLVPHKVIMAAQ